MRRLVPLLALAACRENPSLLDQIQSREMPTTSITTTTNWPALDEKLLADAAETYNFKLGRPSPVGVTPDGAVLFRRTPPRSFAADLFELDTKTGQVKTLLSASAGEENLSDAEKARRERSRTATRGIVSVDVSADGRWVMAPLAGKLLVVDRTTGAKRELDPGGADDPHMSPDGARVGFVRDGSVWVLDVAGGAPRQLTKHAEGIEHGTADFAAQEELDRYRGWWWSPDSKQIVYQVTDTREMDTLYVADARHPEKQPVPFKYPRAGTKNAKVSLARVGIDGRDLGTLPWDNVAFEYLSRVSWQASGPLTIVVFNREQTDLKLIAFDDANKPTELLAEHDDAWLERPAKRSWFGHAPGAPLWSSDGASFWWMTATKGDEWTLEHHAFGAKPPQSEPQMTIPNNWSLQHLIGVDGDVPIIEVSKGDPLRTVIQRGEWTSKDDGVTSADYDNGILVVTTQLAKGGARTYAVTGDGKEIELPSVAEEPSLVPTTKFETVTLEGRTHYTTITRPRSFDPAKKYPVILKVYAGPGAQFVDAARDGYVMDQWYADAGFIVVRSDNRGTPHRGFAWYHAILKDLITVPLADQVAALQALGAKHPEMDMARVGVTGWSFGGYFSAMAVMQRPDVFKAGIAGAPVTDWKLYDTAYTERYMREPRHNEAGYERANVLTYASKLSRPLLVVHGITDDNVHFAHTLALIEALYVAGKRAEVITLSSTHMVPDPKLNLAREQQQIDFFRKNL
ncbi:MAG TPA: prolyl oligopeptidase family serine peptidase [Kofleriaceae bacterium]|nr:prolyl oligopeptidase family serine peptidase [Kofleriaceae bacterium]